MHLLIVALGLLLCGSVALAQTFSAEDAIQPWPENPRYWQFNGKPILLVGGSVEDNLFQIPNLLEHLDQMAAVGANYVRNTMSDRDPGDRRAFLKLDDGRYDLKQWNPAYWDRFEQFLQWTHDRDIIVQIEVWDRFDHARGPWETDPFNPANNINYTEQQSGLAAKYPDHPGKNKQPFFFSVPALENNTVLLPYQQAFVDKMLSISLKYPHVLYCMDNETSGDEQWSRYWAEYIRAAARKQGRAVQLTEMWDDHDIKGETHARTIDHPDLYSFIDISQNNHQKGDAHWANPQWLRAKIARNPRPINSVKIYGADGGPHGGDSAEAIRKFYRNLLGGFASARFHRPKTGLGLSEPAKLCIRAARQLEQRVKLWDLQPDAAHERLGNRKPDSVYLACNPGQTYVVYFPAGGAVELDLHDATGPLRLSWLDLSKAEWGGETELSAADRTTLRAPTEAAWIALIDRP